MRGQRGVVLPDAHVPDEQFIPSLLPSYFV